MTGRSSLVARQSCERGLMMEEARQTRTGVGLGLLAPATEPVMLSLQGLRTDLLCWPARSSQPSSGRLHPESVVARGSPGAALGIYCRAIQPSPRVPLCPQCPAGAWHRHDCAGDQHMALPPGSSRQVPARPGFRHQPASPPALVTLSHFVSCNVLLGVMK